MPFIIISRTPGRRGVGGSWGLGTRGRQGTASLFTSASCSSWGRGHRWCLSTQATRVPQRWNLEDITCLATLTHSSTRLKRQMFFRDTVLLEIFGPEVEAGGPPARKPPPPYSILSGNILSLWLLVFLPFLEVFLQSSAFLFFKSRL